MNSGEEIVAALKAVTVQSTSGHRILDSANLQLKRGEVTCLVGPSGSGKTTAALLLLGLLPPGTHLIEGNVVFQGKTLDPNRAEQYAGLRGTSLAIVFQDPYASLNPLRRCGPQAEDPIRLHCKETNAAAKARVLEQFKAMGFDDPERIYQSFPNQLSGGQRQRVLLALATILNPQVLIADEPTASLDAVSQQQVIGLLQSLAKRQGTAVLLISHDMELVQSIGEIFFEIRDGSFHHIDGASMLPIKQREEMRHLPASTPLLEVRALTKSYPRMAVTVASSREMVVLENISLQVGAGEMVGIFGPSGAGKTTLGRCIAGLEEYQAGQVILAGTQVKPIGLRPHDGRIQMVYQSPASSLNPRMRISETIEEALRQAGVDESQYKREVAALLTQVGLPESTANRYPDSLSGGEKQRVVVARCLARRPQLIVADEPTAALDEQNKHIVLELLRRIATNYQLAVILITHEHSLALRYCDRVFEFSGSSLVHKTQIEEGQIK